MYVYTPGQWALLFFFYCFCGWVWESCYVSAKQRHWVNRGFLHGPLLPIYGSGAIIILFATLPVADNFWLVYFLGMLAATALEYVVGAVMEQLFKVRYWDYTKQPFNLHGYICLTSSIAWGFFSDLLIYVIHPPIDKLLHKLPALLVNPLAAVIAVLFIMDTVKSTKAAIDLREVLTKLTEENAELRRLAKKAEAAQARTAEELQAFREKTSLDRYLLQSYLADELEARQAGPEAAPPGGSGKRLPPPGGIQAGNPGQYRPGFGKDPRRAGRWHRRTRRAGACQASGGAGRPHRCRPPERSAGPHPLHPAL